MTHNPKFTVNSTPDDRIDRVLQALGSIESPPGLQSRVHNRIAQARLAEAKQANTLPAPHLATRHFFAVFLNAVRGPGILSAPATRHTLAAASLAAVAAISIFALHSRTPGGNQAAAPLTQTQLPTQRTASGGKVGLHSRHLQTPARAAFSAEAPSPAVLERARLQGRHKPRLQNAFLATEGPSIHSTNPDTIALAETLAPSRAAPPLPLTQEERLMLAVLRSGDQEELAALDPTYREAVLRQDQEAFQRFFAPPAPANPILEAKNGDTE